MIDKIIREIHDSQTSSVKIEEYLDHDFAFVIANAIVALVDRSADISEHSLSTLVSIALNSEEDVQLFGSTRLSFLAIIALLKLGRERERMIADGRLSSMSKDDLTQIHWLRANWN